MASEAQTDEAPRKILYADTPPELHKRARLRAVHEGRTLSALVRDAVERYLNDADGDAA